MKLKYFFFTVLSAIVAFGACTKDESLGSLKNIQVSKNFVAISPAGGSDNVQITSTSEWEITKAPDWVILSSKSGAAGKSTLTITLEKCDYGRQAELQIAVGKLVQFITVRQGEMTVETVTCKEAMEGTEGKTYRVKGTVVSIYSDVYGNMYLDDGSGTQCNIYGTLDKDGAEKNFKSLGIEIGDVITVEGPLQIYGGTTPELVNVTVVEIEKSLLKIDKNEVTVAKEGGNFIIRAAYKGNGAFVELPEGSFVSLTGSKFIAGIPSKLEKSPADTLEFSFSATANEGDVRHLTFSVFSSRKAVDGDGKIIYESDGSAKIEKTVMDVTVTQDSGLACYSLPYEEKFDTGLGAWEIENVKIAEGKSYVWTWDTHGYIKGSAGVKADAEAYVVSPLIDLTNVTDAHVSFEHVSRYFANEYEEQTLWASGDNGQTWEQLLIPFYSTGKDWNFVNSGNISLKAYTGKQLKLKFKYVSNANAYSTWEVKNLKVEEGSGTLTSIAEIAGMGYNKDVTSNFTATLKDAVVTYVNGSNAFIEDATGGLLLYKSGHGFVAGDKINGAVSGKITFYGGFAEATALDASAATLTKDAQIVPTEITIDKLLAGFNRYVSCNVIIKDVTLGAALVSNGNRNTTLTCGESTISAYAKVKTISLDANVTGALRCYPCYNNSVEKKQVGIWDAAHFTPAN